MVERLERMPQDDFSREKLMHNVRSAEFLELAKREARRTEPGRIQWATKDIVQTYARTGDYASVQKVLSSYSGQVSDRVDLLQSVAAIAAENGEKERARQYLDESVTFAEKASTTKPFEGKSEYTEKDYIEVSAARAYAALDFPERALALTRTILKRNQRLTDDLLYIIPSNLHKHGHTEEVRALLSDIFLKTDGTSEKPALTVTDAELYSMALADIGDGEEAVAVLGNRHTRAYEGERFLRTRMILASKLLGSGREDIAGQILRETAAQMGFGKKPVPTRASEVLDDAVRRENVKELVEQLAKTAAEAGEPEIVRYVQALAKPVVPHPGDPRPNVFPDVDMEPVRKSLERNLVTALFHSDYETARKEVIAKTAQKAGEVKRATALDEDVRTFFYELFRADDLMTIEHELERSVSFKGSDEIQETVQQAVAENRLLLLPSQKAEYAWNLAVRFARKGDVAKAKKYSAIAEERYGGITWSESIKIAKNYLEAAKESPRAGLEEAAEEALKNAKEYFKRANKDDYNLRFAGYREIAEVEHALGYGEKELSNLARTHRKELQELASTKEPKLAWFLGAHPLRGGEEHGEALSLPQKAPDDAKVSYVIGRLQNRAQPLAEKLVVRGAGKNPELAMRAAELLANDASGRGADILFNLFQQRSGHMKDGPQDDHVAIVSALAQLDLGRGTSKVHDLLCDERLKDKDFNDLTRLLVERGILQNLALDYLGSVTESASQLNSSPLSEETRKYFFKQLIRSDIGAVNTTLLTLANLRGEISLETRGDADNLLEAIERLGVIMPVLYKGFREAKAEGTEDAFVAQENAFAETFWKNEPVKRSGKEQTRVAERIHYFMRPQGMSLGDVERWLGKIDDRCDDLKEYKDIIPKEGYEFAGTQESYEFSGERNGQIESFFNSLLARRTTGGEDIAKALHAAFSSRVFHLNHDEHVKHIFTLLSAAYTTGIHAPAAQYLAAPPNTPEEYRGKLQEIVEEFETLFEEWAHYPEALQAFIDTASSIDPAFKEMYDKLPVERAAGKLFTTEEREEIQPDRLKAHIVARVLRNALNNQKSGIVTLAKRELKKFKRTEVSAENSLQAHISKNAASFFAKAGAGICIDTDVTLYNNPNHFHINVADGSELKGNVLVLVHNDKATKEKMLIMYGFNPTKRYVEKGVSPEAFVESALSIGKDFIKKYNAKFPDKPFNRLCITDTQTTLSNREPIYRYLKNKYLTSPAITLETPVQVASSYRSQTLYNIPLSTTSS